MAGHDLKDFLEELEFKSGESRRSMLLEVLGVLLHVGVGIIFMVYLEGWHPRDATYFTS